AALDKSGKADDTLVLFTSEQGSQFPGCKWTNFDTGLHTALIARWPGKTPIGKRSDAIVQWVDILPTLLDIADAPSPKILDGSSFLPVIRGERDSHRKFAYGVHNNIPEGPSYPIRTITDGKHRYIRNLRPDEIYIEKHLMGSRGDGALNNPYWATWIWDSQANAQTYKLVKRYTSRPAEELYNTANDHFELTNLAENPEAKAIKDSLSAELDGWLKVQGDPGAEQDTQKTYQAARKGEHRF
ncbi:MAG: N-sulfoglucosamine sulfohydrolase, partial [Rhodothermales bacterium]